METVEVKPAFRFRHRMSGRYFWEPLNDAARALLAAAPGTSTRVSAFWGDGRSGLDVTVRAHDRASELGMTPDQYREHVWALAILATGACTIISIHGVSEWAKGFTLASGVALRLLAAAAVLAILIGAPLALLGWA